MCMIFHLIKWCYFLINQSWMWWAGCNGVSDEGQDSSGNSTQAFNRKKCRHSCCNIWWSNSRKWQPWGASQQEWYLHWPRQKATPRTFNPQLVILGGLKSSFVNDSSAWMFSNVKQCSKPVIPLDYSLHPTIQQTNCLGCHNSIPTQHGQLVKST